MNCDGRFTDRVIDQTRMKRFTEKILNWWRNRREYAIVQSIIKANQSQEFNRNVEFDSTGLADDSGVFRWICEDGIVSGLVGIRHEPSVPALRKLCSFTKQGGKLVYLPMWPGLPTPKRVDMYAAAGYGPPNPPEHIQKIPHIDVINSDMFPMGRFNPREINKQFDFFIVTWAGDICHKRWDLVLDLLDDLCPEYNICIVAYKGEPTPEDWERINRWIETGALTFYNDWIPKSVFPRLLSRSKVLIVPSEYDCKPRIMDQALLLNIPIAVNNNIFAGHYLVNSESGILAPPEKLSEYSVEVLSRSNELKPRAWYLENHGTYNNIQKMTRFLNETFGIDKLNIMRENLGPTVAPEYMNSIQDLPQEPSDFEIPNRFLGW